MKKYIDSDGTELEVRRLLYYIYYLNKNEEYHRLDGPAIIYDYNGEDWYKENELHRIGGPAFIREDMCKHWVNGHSVKLYYIYG